MYKKKYKRIGFLAGIAFGVIFFIIGFLSNPVDTEGMLPVMVLYTSPVLGLLLMVIGGKIGNKKDLQIQDKVDEATIILGFIAIVYILYVMYATISMF